MQQGNFSDSAAGSELASLFAHRVTGTSNAWMTISSLVSALHGDKCKATSVTRLENYLADRNVSDLVYDTLLDGDGFIQPLGLSFLDGFRISLNPLLPATRIRFTLAHELCHTFFYEHVPELKFMPHECDEAEERLCNFGAAELLMPQKSVMKMAKNKPVCLQSLEALAHAHIVSTEAMLVRLRSLRIWNAELSVWKKGNTGDFVSYQSGTVSRIQWRWSHDELTKTWETGRPATGKTFIEHTDANGSRRVLPISYDMRRRRGNVEVLWGNWASQHRDDDMALFRTNCEDRFSSSNSEFSWGGATQK